MKWAVSLVFAYGHFNIPLGCEILDSLILWVRKIMQTFIHHFLSAKDDDM